MTPTSYGFTLQPVDPGQPPQFVLRQDRLMGTTESWRTWAENREVDEWLQCVAGVVEQGWNDQYVAFHVDPFILISFRMIAQRTPRQYEFPTGYNTYFGVERYQVGENLFTHTPALQVTNLA